MSSAEGSQAGGTFFQRYFLPAFALKGVIIGGGYATGRELVEYFLSQGPIGALLAMALATVVWTLVAVLTFAFALQIRAYDYRAFISGLLGRGAIVFEVCYLAFSVLLLAVFGAAAGEVVASLFDVPVWVGTILLAFAIALVAGVGERAVELMFKYVSAFLYAVYALFLVLALSRFGGRIGETLSAGGTGSSWPLSGLAYGSYNIVAAVMILPVLRHLTTRRQAVVAGLVAGPLAMLPALAFTIAMFAFYPAVNEATLPSDVILREIGIPAFRLAFQLMVLGALLESGVGVVHALNERALAGWEARRGGLAPSRLFRPALTVAALALCMFVANRVGLVDLIASGYRLMGIVFLFTFVIPLCVIGTRRLFSGAATAQ